MRELMRPLPTPARVAVVGCGYFGRLHVEAWSRVPGATLVGVCDRDPALAEAAAAAAGAPAFADAAAMVAALTPDLVDLAVPPAAHLATIRALAGVVPAIICQKPFCGGLAPAREAVAIAAAAGTRLAVHENVRFQPWHQAARRLIAAGAVGRPHLATFRLRPGDGQGPDAYLARQPYFRVMPRLLIHETLIHWIDCLRFLMGQDAVAVYARIARRNPVIAGEDCGQILLDLADGAWALIDGDRHLDHAAADRRRTLGELWVEGSAGALRLDGDGRLWRRGFGATTETEEPVAWEDRGFGGDCVRLCAQAILAAWQAGDPAPTEAAAYLRNQAIEAAAYASAAEGRRVTLDSED